MHKLEAYRDIVGDDVIAGLYKKARKIYGRRVVHINSTYYGGGVAEILNSLIPLMNDAGVEADWRILRGTPDFFSITKKFHNALQGDDVNLTPIKKSLYAGANEDFSSYCHIDQDCVVIHDPQPLPLVDFYRRRQPWVWRCHVDLSTPDAELWDFLKTYIIRYDIVVVSSEAYKRDDLSVEQVVIHPAIDPLSPKNFDVTDRMTDRFMRKFEIETDKPIISQISRFDKWKDMDGVLDVFERVRKHVDCRLVLCGSMAADDPEGHQVYERIKRRANSLVEDGEVTLVTSENNMFVNCLQRRSAVVIQKSIREGFGLTVTEALWKGKPVVASRAGGIPIQITDGVNGFLLNAEDTDGFASVVTDLLKKPELRREIGERAKKTVRDKFLITRLLSDHLTLLGGIIR
jgi:trehalose synthase